MRVVAADPFYNRARYDDVIVHGEGGQDWHARVLLVFTCVFEAVEKKLVFLRYYKEDGTDPITRCNRLKDSVEYEVAEVSSIMGRFHRVDLPSDANGRPKYLVNRFINM